MPMYRGGQQIRSAFQGGAEMQSAFVGGQRVYSTTPAHTHSFDVGVEFTSGGAGDNYGRHYANLPTGDVGTVAPPNFTGSTATAEITTLRVGEYANDTIVTDAHGWSMSFDTGRTVDPGTGDGSALQQVWVETTPGNFLLLYDVNDPLAGVFYLANQTHGHEADDGYPGWSLEGINSGRAGDANPWKPYVGQTKKCLLNFNSSIPAQTAVGTPYHWGPE